MTTVLLLSDTHGWLDPALDEYFSACDEIWHAGDIGSIDVLRQLQSWSKPLRIVFGNIDSASLRRETDEILAWSIEDLNVLMVHIGGYPPNYNKDTREIIDAYQPGLFICGHSHILKIMPDRKRGLLHINPGAAGYIGFHKMRTAVRFSISEGVVGNVEVIELGPRGQTNIEH